MHRLAMEAPNKNKLKGIIDLSTVVPDPPRARGVKAAPEISKPRPTRNLGIMAGMVTGRASVGRRRKIHTIWIWESQTRE